MGFGEHLGWESRRARLQTLLLVHPLLELQLVALQNDLPPPELDFFLPGIVYIPESSSTWSKY